MAKFVLKFFKGIIIGSVAIILVTVGIDAADNYNNLKESLVGKLIYGEAEGPCPEDMIFIPTENGGFCIDKYEESAGENCLHLEVANQKESKDNIEKNDCAPVSVAGNMPWRYISQSHAQVACAKAGKRLPTSEEWYLASLGTPDKNNEWDRVDCQVDNNWEHQPGLTGSGKTCVSAAGAFDMIGNVWEWVKGEARDGKIGDILLPESGFVVSVDTSGLPIETIPTNIDLNYNNDYFWIKENDIRAIARGGYWANKEEAGVYSMYLVPPPTYTGPGIGFRCAK